MDIEIVKKELNIYYEVVNVLKKEFMAYMREKKNIDLSNYEYPVLTKVDCLGIVCLSKAEYTCSDDGYENVIFTTADEDICVEFSDIADEDIVSILDELQYLESCRK